MESYQVGQSELVEYELDYIKENFPGAVYIVYEYENNTYDGEGQAIVKDESGFWAINLSHCSCYGPGQYQTGTRTTLEEIFNSDCIHDTDVTNSIREKISELESVVTEVK